jgi:hypothetical protein
MRLTKKGKQNMQKRRNIIKQDIMNVKDDRQRKAQTIYDRFLSPTLPYDLPGITDILRLPVAQILKQGLSKVQERAMAKGRRAPPTTTTATTQQRRQQQQAVGEEEKGGGGEDVWLSPASCMFDGCQEATRHMMSGGMIELAKVC